MHIPRWLLATLLAMLILGVMFAHAEEEDDSGEAVDATEDSVEDEDVAPEEEELKDPDAITGIFARASFPGFSSLKLPAGEKIPTLVGINNAPTNPNYQVLFVTAQLSPAGDTSRFVQNFSGAAYNRAIAPSETSTFKYSFTPDAMIDPNEYALVVRVFFNNAENKTFVLSAFNETVTITEPLGTDFKSLFTVVGALAGLGYAVYYFLVVKKSKAPTRGSRAASAPANPKEIDQSYIPADHRRYLESLEAKKRNRSSSK